MLPKQLIFLAAIAAMPLASGQDKSPSFRLDAHDPASSLQYESALSGYRTFHDEGATPDQVWRQANDDMGMLGGHAGHLSQESSKQSGQEENATSTQTERGDHGKHH